MNKNQILKADILDIVFENRNKAYGTYVLRKFYPNRLKLALGLMFIIATIFSAFTIMPSKANNGRVIINKIPETVLRDVDMTPKEPKKEPIKEPKIEKPVAKTAEPVIQKKQSTNILIVPNTEKVDIVKTILPTDNIGTENIDKGKSGPPLVQPVQPQPGNGETEKVVPKVDVNTPMDGDAVDVLPSYPGGMDALRRFLEKNLENPYDLENGEIVSVQIKFVVGYNGKLKSFVTVQDGGEAYNKEVVRVLKKMPDWIPGKAKGENVSVYYTVPVKFVMSN